MLAALHFLARYGRQILVAGLIAGVALPGVAQSLKVYLPEMVAALLFISFFRIGAREAFGKLSDLPLTLGFVIVFQIITPLVLWAVFRWFDFSGPIATATLLMACGSSIAGAVNLSLMIGGNAAPALRLLVVGTALLPLTVIPTFLLMPQLGSAAAIFATSGRLLFLITCAGGAAFLLRHLFLKDPSKGALKAIDGVSALAMAIVVIGLMAEIGPALQTNLAGFALTLVAAFAGNFGLQMLYFAALKHTRFEVEAMPFGIVAGNRNMALFLAALPFETMEPLLLYVGCYQIPMYLTPVLLKAFYRR